MLHWKVKDMGTEKRKIKIDPRVISLLAEHGIHSLNSEKFLEETHEMDNHIIMSFDYMLKNPGTYPNVLGYNEHPSWNEREDCIGVMFEDKDGREFWCHVPAVHFEPWNMGEIFNDEELANDESDCDLWWD